MPEIVGIAEQLHRLRLDTHSDFVAVALPDSDQRIRFHYADGNDNDRYRHMIVRSGRGVAGVAILLDRMSRLEKGHPQFEKLRLECPVMLAEKLYAAVAIPVILPLNRRGVLLTGSRSFETYTDHETELMLMTAEAISEWFRINEITAKK
ncbi:GAF domain-containing protein [Paenibacillus tyrfis]|uniref:GAF domain-containing protein n=1 Tax=Paenibacillus tyrfis TaxID=1501230 RepID=UPI00209E49E3|nr:GAF domain-containing protein [Paenibacillus tyrfis]MCP1312581.1 GAF domain-containing protein [Paenibacillus tyrfis]